MEKDKKTSELDFFEKMLLEMKDDAWDDEPEEHELELFSDKPLRQDLYYILGNFGYKDKDGNVVIPPKYIVAGDFYNGYAVVGVKSHVEPNGRVRIDEYNYIDTSGNTLFESGFMYALPFNDNGVALVRINKDLVALVDHNGIIEGSEAHDYTIEGTINANLWSMTKERYLEYEDEHGKGVYDTLKKTKLTDKNEIASAQKAISYKFRNY